MPRLTIHAGAVARSILLGMCATGPLIHQHCPDFPPQLLSGTQLEMPAEMRLYVALTRGLTARVAGPTVGYHNSGPNYRPDSSGKALGRSSIASVYFPPLAWELVHTGETVLTYEGWADVSSWTTMDPGESRWLNDLVTALPAACHPWHHPTDNEHWTELLSTEIAPIVECENIEGGPPDPLKPSTRATRVCISMDEFRELARRGGLTT
jgi:hypothetical protein